MGIGLKVWRDRDRGEDAVRMGIGMMMRLGNMTEKDKERIMTRFRVI
jgi:hypothetical protein